MLTGLMTHRPLLVMDILDYAAEIHPDQEVVSSTVEGGLHRATHPQLRRRVARLAGALRALGVQPGDRVATLAWNGYRHFELYYAIAGIGAVCHTVNPRLSADQFAYVVNHAGDRLLFFDTTFVPLLAALRDRLADGLRMVALCTPEATPAGHESYEALLAAQPEAPRRVPGARRRRLRRRAAADGDGQGLEADAARALCRPPAAARARMRAA